jgi:hypothetical protein
MEMKQVNLSFCLIGNDAVCQRPSSPSPYPTATVNPLKQTKGKTRGSVVGTLGIESNVNASDGLEGSGG